MLTSKFIKSGLYLAILLCFSAGLFIPTMSVQAAGPNPSNETKFPGPNNVNIVGKISVLSGNSVTITPTNSSGSVTVIIGTGTTVDLHGTVALAVGQIVQVSYNSQTMVADRITVNPLTLLPFNPRPMANIFGTISAVSTNSITVTTNNTTAPVTLSISANTTIHGTSALAVGQIVQVSYNSQTMIAERITVNPLTPLPNIKKIMANISGTITAVTENSVSISTGNSTAPTTITIDTNTMVDLRGTSALATGQKVEATYNSQTMIAERITVNPLTPLPNIKKIMVNISGNITAVSGNSVSISTGNNTAPVTITIDSNSMIDLRGASALTAGQTIQATYNSQTMVAERIAVNMDNIKPNGKSPQDKNNGPEFWNRLNELFNNFHWWWQPGRGHDK
jgi:succinate dehydrogenase/fumarate reductase-like Fe-S protein